MRADKGEIAGDAEAFSDAQLRQAVDDARRNGRHGDSPFAGYDVTTRKAIMASAASRKPMIMILWCFWSSMGPHNTRPRTGRQQDCVEVVLRDMAI